MGAKRTILFSIILILSWQIQTVFAVSTSMNNFYTSDYVGILSVEQNSELLSGTNLLPEEDNEQSISGQEEEEFSIGSIVWSFVWNSIVVTALIIGVYAVSSYLRLRKHGR